METPTLVLFAKRLVEDLHILSDAKYVAKAWFGNKPDLLAEANRLIEARTKGFCICSARLKEVEEGQWACLNPKCPY